MSKQTSIATNQNASLKTHILLFYYDTPIPPSISLPLNLSMSFNFYLSPPLVAMTPLLGQEVLNIYLVNFLSMGKYTK